MRDGDRCIRLGDKGVEEKGVEDKGVGDKGVGVDAIELCGAIYPCIPCIPVPLSPLSRDEWLGV
jgi:hypothetical protein